MPKAFTDVSEIELLAGRLADAGDEAIDRTREFVRTASADARSRMRAEVPVETGETRDSITVEIDDDGMGASIGPTNRGDKGEPIGFFIEFGAGNRSPDPFVLRTSTWAERVFPNEAERALEDIL